MGFRAELLLNLWSGDIINDILCANVAILGYLHQMELDVLYEVVMVKD